MTLFLDDGDIRLYQGDVRETLRELEPESVHCVVTSPPYWGLRDYGTGVWEGGDPDCDHQRAKPERMKEKGAERGYAPGSNFANYEDGYASSLYFGEVCGKCGASRVDNQLGLEPTPDLYLANMVAVFREVRRVLRPDGTCWVNMGDSYAGQANGRSRFGQGGDEKTIRRPGYDGQNESGTTPRPLPAGLKPKDLCLIPSRLAQALQAPYYTGTIRSEVDRTWLAAMIDAEGSIFIQRQKPGTPTGRGRKYVRTQDSYGPGIVVTSTTPSIVRRCHEIAGVGTVRQDSSAWYWRVTGRKQVMALIAELYPHFVEKHHQARLAYGCPSSGPDAERAHESLKALHQGGEATIDFKPPESMFEPGWYLRSVIVWSKPNPMPESVTDRPTTSHEYVYLLAKSPRYFFDQEAVREPNRLSDTGWVNTRSRDGELHGNGETAQDGNGTARVGRIDSGRNIRSVWEIPTQPYPEAHFATYPEELVRRCVLAGTSERGCCAECGAPWTRETSATYDAQGRTTNGPRSTERRHESPGREVRMVKDVATTGWRPVCDHGLEPVPCTVLDPFGGSGTTALVARKHGRRSILVELNPSYCELAARRLSQLSLLAEVPETRRLEAHKGLTGGAYSPPGQSPHSNARKAAK